MVFVSTIFGVGSWVFISDIKLQYLLHDTHLNKSMLDNDDRYVFFLNRVVCLI